MHIPRAPSGRRRVHVRRVFLVACFITLGGVTPLQAADPEATPAPPREVLSQRPITVDEAVAIALEYQPNILARLGDYAAAKYRVDQALAPLLPQLAASISTTRSQTTIMSTNVSGVTAEIPVTRDFGQTLV